MDQIAEVEARCGERNWLDQMAFAAGLVVRKARRRVVTWGSGAFLALPAEASLAASLLFSAGAGAILAVILRAKGASVCFLAPVTLLTLAAGNYADGGAVAILLAGLAAGGLAWLVEMLSLRDRMPGLALPHN